MCLLSSGNCSLHWFSQTNCRLNGKTFCFEGYCTTLPLCRFNSASYKNKLLKSYFISFLVNERDIEPIVIKKANQFVSLKIDNVHFFDILDPFGGATNLASLLKTLRSSETKSFFPHVWFNHRHKLNNKELPLYEVFHNKLRICNPMRSWSLVVRRQSLPLSKRVSLKYHLLEHIFISNCRNCGTMHSFKNFLHLYIKRDVVPIFEAM